jgi:hypothetical protein
MKLFRYRRPSLNTLLGITKATKRVKKELGITAVMKPFRAWTNAKRRFKRKIGYESETGRLVRNGLPKPGGCLVVVMAVVGVLAMAAVVFATQRAPLLTNTAICVRGSSILLTIVASSIKRY